MSEVTKKREIRTQKFNCPRLKSIATLEYKYLVLSVGKEFKTGADCRQKHLCGIIEGSNIRWELCPKGKELNECFSITAVYKDFFYTITFAPRNSYNTIEKRIRNKLTTKVDDRHDATLSTL
jgi:hypothetical protein